MEPEAPIRRSRSYELILKAGVLNALLVTVISAMAIALWSGAGTEGLEVRPGFIGQPGWLRGHLPNPVELIKAVALLCPITAASCGSFGLLVGVAGATLMYFRRRRIRTTKRFLVEAVILGFLLALLFPVFDVWMSRAQGFAYYSGTPMLLLTPAFGGLCALICARVFRKRFIESN